MLQQVGVTRSVAHGEPLPEQTPGQSCSLGKGAHTGAGGLGDAAALRGPSVLLMDGPRGAEPSYS